MQDEILSTLKAEVDNSPFKGYLTVFIGEDGVIHIRVPVSLLRLANRRRAYIGPWMRIIVYVAVTEVDLSRCLKSANPSNQVNAAVSWPDYSQSLQHALMKVNHCE